jgi:hypothetical protein
VIFSQISGNAHYIVMSTLQVMVERIADYIEFPPTSSLASVSENFFFPGTVGT